MMGTPGRVYSCNPSARCSACAAARMPVAPPPICSPAHKAHAAAAAPRAVGVVAGQAGQTFHTRAMP